MTIHARADFWATANNMQAEPATILDVSRLKGVHRLDGAGYNPSDSVAPGMGISSPQ